MEKEPSDVAAEARAGVAMGHGQGTDCLAGARPSKCHAEA
jgi:hypothetical protein